MESLRAVDGDGSGASGEVTLSGDDLVVVATKGHALAGPGVKVSLHVDRSAGTLVLANRPVLLKGPSSIDGWLVGTGRLGDLVGRAVSGQGTLVRGLGRWVVSSEVLNDVVLDEWVASPAVDGKVGVAVGVVGTRIGDGTGGSRVPSLSTDEVATTSPVDAVASASTVGVGDARATISPPRVEAAVVSSLSVGSALAGNKVTRRTSSYISGGSSENASGRNSSGDEGGERDHLEYELLVVGSEGDV